MTLTTVGDDGNLPAIKHPLVALDPPHYANLLTDKSPKSVALPRVAMVT